jgi:exonuclease SbcD
VRILHTSDWHLGRRFEQEPLEADQRRALEWLVDLVAAERVDLVVVAGDVYDRALPAEEAVTLLDDALDALVGAGATVLLVPGNHDSARRLGFGAGRQALGGVRVVADTRVKPEPWVFEAGTERVAVVAVPFLDPLTAPAPTPAADGSPRPRTHQHVLEDALAAGRAGLAGLAGVPSIAVAHAFVAGGMSSDSEKLLAVGGADVVDAAVFDGFDYVALGHLHRPQTVGAGGRIAYSGSLLPYSFSEDHGKSVRLLEVSGGAVTDVTDVPIPVGRPVVTLEGRLDDLLVDPACEPFVDAWVAVRLTDDTVQVQPMERLRGRFPHAVNVRYAPSRAGSPGTPSFEAARVEARAPDALVLDFLEEVRGRPPGEPERALVVDAVARAVAARTVGGEP